MTVGRRPKVGFLTMDAAALTDYCENERAFQRKVNDELKKTRLLWSHNKDSRLMEGDNGLLDLIGGDALTGWQFAWELKMPGGVVSKEQRRWLRMYQRSKAHTAIWYPTDLPKIRAILGPYMKGKAAIGAKTV